MLQGKFVVQGHTLMLSGYDISNTFYLRGKCDSRTDRTYFDEGIDVGDVIYPPNWGFEGIYLQVGTAIMKVELLTQTNDEGLVCTNNINKEAFTLLGILLREAKLQCVPNNLIGDHEDYSFSSKHEYSIDGGSIILRGGSVYSLNYSKDGVIVELLDDAVDSARIAFSGKTRNLTLHLRNFNKVEWGVVDALPTSGETASKRFYTLEEVVNRNPNKNYQWMFSRDWRIVTPDTLEEECKRIARHKGIVAVDTETSGFDISFRSEDGNGDTLTGVIFSIQEGESVYFPIRHKYISNIGAPEEIPYLMEKYLKPLLEKKRLVGHNILFDWKVLYTYGINSNFVADTMTATRLTLFHQDTSVSLGLKNLTATILHRDSLELSDFAKDEDFGDTLTFEDMDEESTKYYACADGDNTLTLWNWFEKNNLLEKYNATKVFEIEVLFSKAAGYSEYYGMYTDPEDIEQLQEEMETESAQLYAKLAEEVGHEFNPRSAPQLSKIMFQDMGIEVIRKTSTGNPSTDARTLKELREYTNEDGSPRYPFVNYLLQYRDVAGLLSNFCNPYHKLAKGGFLHSGVQQFLETGRVSINNPNYQSFNDTVKKYIKPRPGFYMFDCDYSSVEYRILVSIAHEASLIDSFEDPDFDYHRRMASMLYGIPYEAVTPAIRSQSKGLNFGIPYGMGVPSLAARMFDRNDPEAQSKAQVLYNKYFEVQPHVRQFFAGEKDKASRDFYNETFFGRRRTYDPRKDKISRIRRQAGNHPIQGTAADLYKMGIGRLFLEICRRGWLGKVLICGFVHDEAVLECWSGIDPAELLDMVRQCMMIEIDGWCPLYIGAGYGTSWYMAKKTELPVQVQQELVQYAGALREGNASGLVKPEGKNPRAVMNLQWDGKMEHMYDWELQLINAYMLNRVLDYLERDDIAGKPLPPTELGFVTDCVKAAKAGQPFGYDYDKDAEISGEKGVFAELADFGKVFRVEDLVTDTGIVESVENVEKPKIEPVSPNDIVFDEPDPDILLRERAWKFGVGADLSSKRIFVKVEADDAAWIKVIKNLIEDEPGDNKLYFVTSETGLEESNYTVSNLFASRAQRLALVRR